MVLFNKMTEAHRRTLEAVLESPPRTDIRWTEVLAMLEAQGAFIEQSDSQCIQLALNGAYAMLYVSQSRPEVGRRMVKDIQQFIEDAGIEGP